MADPVAANPLEAFKSGITGLTSNIGNKITTGLGDIKNTASGQLDQVTGEIKGLTEKAKGLFPGQNAPVAPPAAQASVAPAAGGRRRRSRKSKKSTRKGSSKKRSSKKGKKRSTKKRVRFSRRK